MRNILKFLGSQDFYLYLKNSALGVSLALNFYFNHKNKLEKAQWKAVTSEMQLKLDKLHVELENVQQALDLRSDQIVSEVSKQPDIYSGVTSWIAQYYDPTLTDVLILLGSLVVLYGVYFYFSKPGSSDGLGGSNSPNMEELPVRSGYAYLDGEQVKLIQKRADILNINFPHRPQNHYFSEMGYLGCPKKVYTFLCEVILAERIEGGIQELVDRMNQRGPEFPPVTGVEPEKILEGPFRVYNYRFHHRHPELYPECDGKRQCSHFNPQANSFVDEID